ncbi:calumenin-A-like [Hippoglossus hippoglossus]|uniref:calumenin-A-like n=1 Tax=Hippoglossus hippoglossus TaxID=8267 RepID=UPI00148CE7CD|nr:calumenin-A-like [Hippoglossus hippoglossus]XP_034436603.1 calumenin-A-like [Hippoglossus hippoglossus]
MIRPLLLCFFLCVACGRSKPTEKKSRVVEEEPLSHVKHEDDEGFEYDHEAFLGEDEAPKFDKLPLEESVRRLSLIVDRIDVNKDDFISEDELKIWIETVQRNHTFDQMESQWKHYDADQDGLISWDEYNRTKYSDGTHLESEFNYSKVMVREERHFRAADRDGDFKADKQEFNAFLHPENHQHMREIVVQETIDEIDKNGDGFIDLKEFMDDLQIPENDENFPEWAETERQHFLDVKDKNKDGKLDRQETMEWIFKPDLSYADAESEHLVTESDADKDGKLTKMEILNNHEMFVGSQVTNYGEALLRHDEF